MLITGNARVLGRSHAGQVARVLASVPVQACMVAARFEHVGMDRKALGGQFWGVGGGREGLCFDGANLLPITGDRDAVHSFAHTAGRRGRQCASILGPAELVLPMWELLEPVWGSCRELRPNQPLMTCPDPPACRSDPDMVPVRPDQINAYFPAAVAMFTEEVGVDPRLPDGGTAYRHRLAALIAAGRAFARFEDGRVVAKAEIGAMSRQVGLIQGVWVDPARRGQGLAAPAVAALTREIQRLGRLPSLYVNDFNVAARLAYQRIGFRQTGTFASVLF